jgi:hypothetical protein
VRALLEGNRRAFRDAVVDSGSAPRPDRFDFDAHWDMIAWQWEPYLTSRYTFTPDYIARGQHLTRPSNAHLRQLAIPPEWIWTMRLHWGLHAVLVRLHAEGDFRSVLLEALDAPCTRLAA